MNVCRMYFVFFFNIMDNTGPAVVETKISTPQWSSSATGDATSASRVRL